MGRKKKFDEAELIHIAQEYLLTCDMEKPTYTRLSAWVKESGLDIGEHIFRAIPTIRKMMQQNQQRYAEQQGFPKSVAYVTFDVEHEVCAVRSQEGTKRLMQRLQERERYFRDIYESSSAMADTHKKIYQQLQETAKNQKEMTVLCQRLQEEVKALKAENRKIRQQNVRMKTLLESAVYPEIAAELGSELGLNIPTSKMDNKTLDRMITTVQEEDAPVLSNVVPMFPVQAELEIQQEVNDLPDTELEQMLLRLSEEGKKPEDDLHGVDTP